MTHPTKENLTENAAKLFLHNGFNGTSIAEIVKSVKLSKSSIYHHFKSKDEILDTVIDWCILSDKPYCELVLISLVVELGWNMQYIDQVARIDKHLFEKYDYSEIIDILKRKIRGQYYE